MRLRAAAVIRGAGDGKGLWPGFGFCKAINPGQGRAESEKRAHSGLRATCMMEALPVSSLMSTVHAAMAVALPEPKRKKLLNISTLQFLWNNCQNWKEPQRSPGLTSLFLGEEINGHSGGPDWDPIHSIKRHWVIKWCSYTKLLKISRSPFPRLQ